MQVGDYQSLRLTHPERARGAQLDLDPGDTVFLYSDGVPEVSDPDQVRFGHERLIEILAAHADQAVTELAVAVELALLEFCRGDLRDDVSMLVLRVTG